MAQTSERHEVGQNEQANIYKEHLRGVNQYRQTNKCENKWLGKYTGHWIWEAMAAGGI